jgi:hypothetical protein
MASIHGAAGSSFVGLLAARGCMATPAPGCRFAHSREATLSFQQDVNFLPLDVISVSRLAGAVWINDTEEP